MAQKKEYRNAIRSRRMVTRQVAEERGYTLIDIHDFTAEHPEWFAKDGVHPGNDGAATIAREIAAVLSARK